VTSIVGGSAGSWWCDERVDGAACSLDISIIDSSTGDERHEVGVCESATGVLIVGCAWCWLIARVTECRDSCDRVSGLLRTSTTTDAGSHSATAISDEPLHWSDVHHACRPHAGVNEHLRHGGWCATWFDNFGFVSLNVDIDRKVKISAV